MGLGNVGLGGMGTGLGFDGHGHGMEGMGQGGSGRRAVLQWGGLLDDIMSQLQRLFIGSQSSGRAYEVK